MPSGRSTDRDRRPHQGESPTRRRGQRVREGTPREAKNTGKRPGGKNAKGAARGAKGTKGGKSAFGGFARSRAGSHTGGAFLLSSTRQAAVLAILVCAMALSMYVPLRTYLSQRAELAAQEEKKVALEHEVDRLQQRRGELSDPLHVEAEARARLGMVRPGETPYRVQVPPEAIKQPPPESEPKADDRPWYQRWWNTVTGGNE